MLKMNYSNFVHLMCFHPKLKVYWCFCWIQSSSSLNISLVYPKNVHLEICWNIFRDTWIGSDVIHTTPTVSDLIMFWFKDLHELSSRGRDVLKLATTIQEIASCFFFLQMGKILLQDLMSHLHSCCVLCRMILYIIIHFYLNWFDIWICCLHCFKWCPLKWNESL